MLMDTYGGKPYVVITVAPELPKWIWLDGFLFHLIISNAFSNAVVHGETNGEVKIHVSVSEERQIVVSMSNNPGMKHAENCKLQEEFGFNHLLKGGKDNAQNPIFLSMTPIPPFKRNNACQSHHRWRIKL